MNTSNSSNETTIYCIADKQPEFRKNVVTHIWNSAAGEWWRCYSLDAFESCHDSYDTHWCHSPTRPTMTPDKKDETDKIRRLANECDLTFSEAKYFIQHDVVQSPQLPAEVREAIHTVSRKINERLKARASGCAVRRVRARVHRCGVVGLGVACECSSITDDKLGYYWTELHAKIFIGPWLVNLHVPISRQRELPF